MNKNFSLKDRMLDYENVTNTYLTKRVPVLIRIDGRSFHTFTKKFNKPFDDIFITTMQNTMSYLCSNIQNCVFAYTESDEITLVLIDYQSIDTDAWFDYRVQKLCSVSASMATMAFNKFFKENVWTWTAEQNLAPIDYFNDDKDINVLKLKEIYFNAIEQGAMFDARCFNIPKEEVVNALIYRQQDCTRNSIQMLAQSEFSHKELQGKNQSQLQDMLMLERGINWNDLDTYKKRGSCCIKEEIQDPEVDIKDGPYIITKWTLDLNPPIFTKDRNYIERFIYLDDK
jgi:tRNA(His) 5'-end guanylyltransferase